MSAQQWSAGLTALSLAALDDAVNAESERDFRDALADALGALDLRDWLAESVASETEGRP